MTTITLTTDYGTKDTYVAELKGVILGIATDASLVDVSHDIEPQDVCSGAFVLWQIWRSFPAGTIHVAVVDPGVGTARRIVAGRFAGQYVVAPDNGLLTFVRHAYAVERLHVVTNREYFPAGISATFHGRDIMAPVAAHLANGVPIDAFGPSTDHVELLPIAPRAEESADGLRGRVLHVDRFGTLVTNISAAQITELHGAGEVGLEISINRNRIGPLRKTFADVPEGHAVALIGGGGQLEIAVNRGRAVDEFGHDSDIRVRAG